MSLSACACVCLSGRYNIMPLLFLCHSQLLKQCLNLKLQHLCQPRRPTRFPQGKRTSPCTTSTPLHPMRYPSLQVRLLMHEVRERSVITSAGDKRTSLSLECLYLCCIESTSVVDCTQGQFLSQQAIHQFHQFCA